MDKKEIIFVGGGEVFDLIRERMRRIVGEQITSHRYRVVIQVTTPIANGDRNTGSEEASALDLIHTNSSDVDFRACFDFSWSLEAVGDWDYINFVGGFTQQFTFADFHVEDWTLNYKPLVYCSNTFEQRAGLSYCMAPGSCMHILTPLFGVICDQYSDFVTPCTCDECDRVVDLSCLFQSVMSMRRTRSLPVRRLLIGYVYNDAYMIKIVNPSLIKLGDMVTMTWLKLWACSSHCDVRVRIVRLEGTGPRCPLMRPLHVRLSSV